MLVIFWLHCCKPVYCHYYTFMLVISFLPSNLLPHCRVALRTSLSVGLCVLDALLCLAFLICSLDCVVIGPCYAAHLPAPSMNCDVRSLWRCLLLLMLTKFLHSLMPVFMLNLKPTCLQNPIHHRLAHTQHHGFHGLSICCQWYCSCGLGLYFDCSVWEEWTVYPYTLGTLSTSLFTYW